MDFEQEIKLETLAETIDHCTEIRNILFNKDAASANLDDINELFRIVHSIKGNIKSVGFDKLGMVAHKLEDYLSHVKEGDKSFSEPFHALIMDFADSFEDFSNQLLQDLKLDVDTSSIDQKIDDFVNSESQEVAPEPEPEPIEVPEEKVNKVRILVIDDDDNFISLLNDLFDEAFNCDVIGLNNGAEALMRAQSENFDLICSDYKMPAMDGLEFIEKLRLNPGPNSKAPVLFISGMEPKLSNDPTVWSDVFFVNKPFKSAKLCFFAKAALKGKGVK